MFLTLAEVRNTICARVLPFYYGDFRIVSDVIGFLEELALMADGYVGEVPNFSYITITVHETVNGYDQHIMSYEIKG